MLDVFRITSPCEQFLNWLQRVVASVECKDIHHDVLNDAPTCLQQTPPWNRWTLYAQSTESKLNRCCRYHLAWVVQTHSCHVAVIEVCPGCLDDLSVLWVSLEFQKKTVNISMWCLLESIDFESELEQDLPLAVEHPCLHCFKFIWIDVGHSDRVPLFFMRLK